MTDTKESIVNSKLQTLSRLMNNMVVKQEKRANEFETDEIYYEYEKYRFAIEELDTIDDYDTTWTLEELISLFPGVSVNILRDVVNQVTTLSILYEEKVITKEQLAAALENRRYWRIDTYVERNNYYRMLIGQPPIEDGPDDFVYVDGKPIHEITVLEYYRLVRSGKMDVIIAENPDKEYIQYIGKDISIFDARESEQFQVLWVPMTTESSIYREMFNKERKVYMVTYHNEYLSNSTDYNEAYELVQLKLRAAIYYEIQMNSPTLDKSTFTKEESENLFKEFGLSFPKNMPSSYRDAISFVLSYMVMFKGTNYALNFVANRVFAGLTLYKYFIRKKHKTGINYPIPPGTPPDQVYDVDFILRPYDATNIIDSRDKSREDMILTYDDVVAMDPRWRDSQELKEFVFNSEFSYLESKYISLDNMIDLSELSNGLSVMSRMIIEHKDIFNEYEFVYNVTGVGHTFFNIYIYFLAMYTYMIERIRVIAPDTLSTIKQLKGFRVPENLKQIQTYWIWYFNMRDDVRDMLRDFPEAMTNSDDFLTLLVKMDKSISLSKALDHVMSQCRTFPEVKLVLEIYKLVRMVNTTPSAYGDKYPTIDGISYADWLASNDEILFLEFEKVTSSEDINTAILEMDNIAQFMIQLINDHKTELFGLQNLTNAFNQANMMVGGVSKYLLYILKLFKAYSTDFITDNNILQIDDYYNYQVNIDEIYTKYNISMYQRWNMSQYDWLDNGSIDDQAFLDNSITSDGVYLTTPYGDVKIS